MYGQTRVKASGRRIRNRKAAERLGRREILTHGNRILIDLVEEEERRHKVDMRPRATRREALKDEEVFRKKARALEGKIPPNVRDFLMTIPARRIAWDIDELLVYPDKTCVDKTIKEKGEDPTFFDKFEGQKELVNDWLEWFTGKVLLNKALDWPDKMRVTRKSLAGPPLAMAMGQPPSRDGLEQAMTRIAACYRPPGGQLEHLLREMKEPGPLDITNKDSVLKFVIAVANIAGASRWMDFGHDGATPSGDFCLAVRALKMTEATEAALWKHIKARGGQHII